MSFETECFSMNSDISNRTSDFSEPNKNSARRRATSVLPTPVGPRKKKQPTGRSGDFSPARLRRIARASAGPARNHFLDVLARHDPRGRVVQLETLPQPAQIFFFLALFFGIETRLLEFVIGDRRLHPVRDKFHA